MCGSQLTGDNTRPIDSYDAKVWGSLALFYERTAVRYRFVGPLFVPEAYSYRKIPYEREGKKKNKATASRQYSVWGKCTPPHSCRRGPIDEGGRYARLERTFAI